MAKESKMHQELFDWLREKNLPENEIPRDEKEWFREIAVGFNRLGMEKPADFQKLDWTGDIKRLTDGMVEKYKAFATERKKSLDFNEMFKFS